MVSLIGFKTFREQPLREQTKLQKIDYSDWIDIFDEGLKKIKSLNKLPVLFFSGGKDSTFIASRMIQNNIDALYFSFVTSDSEKKVIAKYFFPIGSTIWYALEYNPKENEFFGYIVKSGHNELGYFELEELEYVTIDGLRVERDLDWESNTTLEEVKRGDKE
jgi:hypothetical protein